MAPKRGRQEKNASEVDPQGMFRGMVVFLVEKGVQPRRLQIWKQKLLQMGGAIEDRLKKTVTHIFAMNMETILQEMGLERLKDFKGNILLYEWLENSLKSGEKLSEDSYALKRGGSELDKPAVSARSEMLSGTPLCNDSPQSKKTRISPEGSKLRHKEIPKDGEKAGEQAVIIIQSTRLKSEHYRYFWKTYQHLQRSFSYYKAIQVIEKLPFKIESVEQVKHLPAIGKSMQDHIHEIVTTGRLSKLEHFENDEKVQTVTLFGEVWGIGPATALKLYDKGHRTLDDLKNEESLTSSQRLGVKYFNDIKQKIPREEVKEMEALLQKAGEAILPGVIIVCGGSYRRGKAFCGDLDIIITHPDGQSHKGFLAKYVNYLKNINFLKVDLVFSTHSEEGTDSGVDTYFGLCTYPGQEHRHRIDLKVYPRDIYAFGLIAWTGNDVLNRRLRLLAESKGYRLDDTGLFLPAQSSHGKRGAKSSTSLHCQAEGEVFDLLGFPWLEPHERNL